MAATTNRKTIGGAEYEIGMLKWGAANELFGRLVKSLGAALGKLATGNSMVNVDIGPVIGKLAQDLTSDDILDIRDILIGEKAIKFKTGQGWPAMDKNMWEVHFAGKYFDSMKVIVFALKVNYGDFLDGVRTAFADHQEAQDLGKKALSVSSGPTPSTPSSTESSPPQVT